ncbi:BZ3500_MvSof-1268-A1-R1_Chr3-1g06111 [Microbotryum saponariae]|uniref:BZ3500_MvSof-1268-A1-R1_Chr3-1g06111 protein n=1 Tax=Microbotryum saponariae TaxID=289078 RepID=A0A2X0LAR7_9BASI|nr:BZ3500_MvSof-1268-A1-R1_Chr3-1g06111 [Microbotryum saponariae]SDA03974.1 BZ3501_MvSof-1269-A2-R1_Chr3-2g05796 [Microbotryum saponariae]
MMDIAMKMSWDLRLHDETTHQLGPDATRSENIDTEMTRRTLWIILSHANFYPTIDRSSSGFNLLDVTARLPCDDEAYVQGCSPRTCSSLMGTVAALRSPESVFRPDQSLFASWVQVTELWAEVSRKASSIDPALHGSWKSETEFSELRLELDQWEAHLPPAHRWSRNNLKHWREQKQDLAFFATNSTLKLAYMSLHRLEVSLLASTAGVYDSQYQTSLVDRDVHTPLSWARITEMMTNEAFEAIAYAKLFFSTRGPRSGCPPFLFYNVFVAAEIALYVLKCQCFDDFYAARAEATFTTGLDILLEAATTWAVAARWHAHLVEGYGNGGYPNPFESSSTLGADLLPPLKPASSGLSLPPPSYPSTGFETYDWDLTQQYTNPLQEETVSPLSSFGGFDPHSLNPLDSSSSTPLEFPPLANAASPNAVPPEFAFPSPNDLTNFSFPYLFEAELAQCSEEMAGPSQ